MKISLLGDSIRLGYEAAARVALGAEHTVWSPTENCMHSVHHTFRFKDWYIDPAADLIHVNFGLWDCRRLGRDRADNAVPVEIFARNLDFILGKMRAASSARLVWATITPIVPARYNGRFNQPYDPCRDGADVARYNAAAAPILARHAVVVNDLHTFVEEQGRESLINEDGIHFTDAGSALLGARVAAVIRATINS